MFSCLTQRVGLRGPCAPTDAPTSGPAPLLLNDLPGLSHLSLSLLGTAETPRAEAVLAEALRTAAVLLVADLQLALAAQGRVGLLHTAVSANPAHWAHAPHAQPQWLPPHAHPQGLALTNDLLLHDSLSISRLYVAGVEVLLADAATGLVLELYDGQQMIPYTFDVSEAGQPVWVPIGHLAQTAQVELWLPANVRPALAHLDACGPGLTAEGVFYKPLGTNWHKTVDDHASPGLRPRFELRCSAQAYVCQHADALVEPLRYRTAIGLLTEALHSERLNAATFDRPALDALRTRYEAQYQLLLQAFVQAQAPLLRQTPDRCWACRGAYAARQTA